MRGRAADYEREDVRVIDVSPDPVEVIAKFAGEYPLDFTLLADAGHELADAFGTWVEKSMYGKHYWGVQRATFITGPDGTILKAFEKVSPKTHDDVVLAGLAELT